MQEQNTHPNISAELVGVATSIDNGTARAELVGTEAMAADGKGLVHGGFTFGLADFAAMCAVNDPNVVLGAADVRFVAPVRVGEVVRAEASRRAVKGRKHTIDVRAAVGERTVLTGSFTTFVLDKHVLDD